MAPPPTPLSIKDLTRVLGLPEDASRADLRGAGDRLLNALALRRGAEIAGGADQNDANAATAETTNADGGAALGEEIAALDAALQHFAPVPRRRSKGRTVRSASKVDRASLVGSLLGAACMLILLVAYAGGFRIQRVGPASFASAIAEPAQLILTGRLPGATLQILDADRERVLVETAAEGASVELREGRYALDVRREDCPDEWTRSVYFEAGATYRFEPFLCAGEGRVTLRSSVPADRLQIDGFDVNPSQSEPFTLGVGDHTLRLEKKGYSPYEARVRITPDQDVELHAELISEATARQSRSGGTPPGISPPRFQTSDLVKPAPFDLGDLKKEIASEARRARPSRLLLRNGLEGLPGGGSTAWHDRVSQELLTRFDSDQSGRIDRLEENEAVPCALWKEIEADFERGGLGLSLARTYGFDGSEWHPNALGFARAFRSVAYVKMMECGLTK